MAFTNQEKAEFRAHAQEVTRIDFVALPQPERDRLEEEYKAEWDEINDTTSIEGNKLKLAIYANLLDPNNNADRIDESAWILSNTTQAQILINTILGRPELVEDGIYGEATMWCVRDVFGLTIPLNSSVDFPAEGLVVPAAMLANTELIARMQEAGITINEDRAVIENPRLLEQFQEYLNLLNFIEDVERDPSNSEIMWDANKNKLMDNYARLINEWSDFLTQDLKEVLMYKYAEAIYNDIIRMGGYISENGTTWEYTIIDISTGEMMSDNPYLRVLREANTRNLIDVAMIISIVRKNFTLNESPIVGDASLVRSLLEQHKILDSSGDQIIEATHLLLDKDNVLAQLNSKLAAVSSWNDTSAQAYQELEFLKSYVEKWEVPRVNYMRSILTQVNEYRGFLEHQATIDGDWSPEDIAHATDEDWVDFAADAVKSNAVWAFILGLIAWFMWKRNVAFWLMGVSLFSGTIANGIHAAGRGTQSIYTDNELELVRMSDINPNVSNPDYQKAFHQMVSINKENLSNRVSWTVELPYVENSFTLARITNAITEDEIDIPNIKSGDSISDMAVTIFDKITNKSVSNDEFSNYTWETIDITLADVEAYLWILMSDAFSDVNNPTWQNENEDRSLRDFLSEWQSIESRPYVANIVFLGNDSYDDALHEYLRWVWNGWTPATRETVENIQRILQRINNSDTATRISEVDRAISDLGRINVSDTYASALRDYKDYFLAEQKIIALRETETIEVGSIVTLLTYRTLSEEKQISYIAIMPGIIAWLESTKAQLWDSTQHISLKARIDEIIEEKEQITILVQQLIEERNIQEINRQREEAGLPPLWDTPSNIEAIWNQEQFTNMINNDPEKLDQGVQWLLNIVGWININNFNGVSRFLEDESLISSFHLLSEITIFSVDSTHDDLYDDTIANSDGSINYQRKVIVTLRNRWIEEVNRIENEIQEITEAYFAANNEVKTSIDEISFDYSRIWDPTYITELSGKINGVNIARLEAAPNVAALTEIWITGIAHSTITPEALTQLFEDKLEGIITAISTEIAGEDDINNLNIAKDTIIPALRAQGIDTTAIEWVITGRIQEINAAVIAAAAEEARRNAAERNRVLALKTTDAEITRKGIDTHMRALQSDLEALTSGADVALAQLANDSLLIVEDTGNVKVSEILEVIQTAEYSNLSSVAPFLEWYKECGLID